MPDTSDIQQLLETRARERLGRTLRDKYTLDKVLGIGGMATVYAATHRNGNEVALKLLHPELAFHPSERARFLREGYVANQVKHPGAVSVIDDDVTEDDWAFLVMELLHGLTVDELWESRELRLAPGLVVAIALQLLDVIEAAHASGVVHRNLKPANLFLTKEGELKVLDFGIARLRDATGHRTTNVGTVIGTPSFMAPEQAIGRSKEVDERTNLWAIGSVAFALLAGDVVHPAESMQETLIRAATQPARAIGPLVPGLPASIARVIDRSLAFDKRERWAAASEMREALATAANEEYGELPGREVIQEAVSAVPVPAKKLVLCGTVDLPHADTETPPDRVVLADRRLEPVKAASRALVTMGADAVASSPATGVRIPEGPPSALIVGRRIRRFGIMGALAIVAAAVFVLRGGAAPVASAAPSAKTVRAVVGDAPTPRPADADAAPSESNEMPASLPPTGSEPAAEAPTPPPAKAPTTEKAEAATAHVPRERNGAVVSSVAPRAAPSSGRPSCTPPFVIQPKTGRKIWKLECL